MRKDSDGKFFLIPGVRILLCFLLLFTFSTSFGQNDNCINASVVNIPSNGFAIGSFNGAISNISTATVEPGETFAPAILVASQTQKSVWYKFTIPTNRTVRVTLVQSGSGIASGDVGFAIYKSNTCLPGVSDISTKLTPIGLFGSTFHPCIGPGIYLVQVSAKSTAFGSIFIQVETGNTSAAYDQTAQAYNFGTLSEGVKTITYSVDCQSTENAAEICTSLINSQQYNKSTWHVFKTGSYFDYVAFFLAYQNFSISHKMGYKLYLGDVRSSPFSSFP